MITEQKVLELIATDRIDIPLSSMEQRLRRGRKALAGEVAEYCVDGVRFSGARTYAFVETEDKERARGMKEAIAEFAEEFPKYGNILKGKIAEKRVRSEVHLYMGVNPGCRLTADDYLGVMASIGLSEGTARALYPELMDVSRKLSRARDEERSIIVGKYSED